MRSGKENPGRAREKAGEETEARRLLRFLFFSIFLVAVVVGRGKVERGGETARGAAARRVRVLENRGSRESKRRKGGGRMGGVV